MLDFDNKVIYDAKGSDRSYYDTTEIDAYRANINMIVGRRSNGKSYSVLAFDCIMRFINSDYKDQFAYVRRYDEELSLVSPDIFTGMVANGWLSWYTHDKWNDITYYRHCWYLRKLDENGEVVEKCTTPMAYGFAINTSGKAKGPDRPNIKTIVFDEFIPIEGDRYVAKESSLWNNLISTIDRNRNQCVIYMIANTISKNCPHFDYYHIDPDMLIKGKINIIKVGTVGKLAVEYCQDTGDAHTKDSVYFTVEDEVGSMILGGDWQASNYPTLPDEYKNNLEDLTRFKFYLYLKNNKLVEGRFLATPEISTIYFSMYNDLINATDIVFTEEWYNDGVSLSNVHVGLNGKDNISQVVLSKILNYRCYYESNDVGEKVRHMTTI